MRVPFLILFLFFGGFKVYSQEDFLDIKSIKKEFPYNKLKTYKIDDSLTIIKPVDEKLKMQLFQYFLDEPTWNDFTMSYNWEKEIIDNTYLISYHDYYHYDIFNMDFDIITVYATSKDTSRIYWLSYASKDQDINDDINIKKGKLSSSLYPTLAEKYNNDSIHYESYSVFLDPMVIKKTEVNRNNSSNTCDSTITIFRLVIADLQFLMDRAEYRNGELIEDFENNELREEYGY